ncbi:MAG: polysaccharide biosynthesis C-terminal domain-containing protein [Oscillospiraceae bacterium]|nr:polysaccharide biosynthesis C-terminal domain-containing protein [Oscillospiraceae bacterium]
MGFRKDSVFYSAMLLCFSSLALQGMGFLYRIAMSRMAGAQVMGLYQLILPAYAVGLSCTCSGLTLAVSRVASAVEAVGDRGSLWRIVPVSRAVFLLLFAAAGLPVLLFSRFIASSLLGDARVRTALLLLLPCLFLTGLENIYKNFFHGVKYVLPPIVSELTEQFTRMAAVLSLFSLFLPCPEGDAAALIVGGMVLSEVFSVAILTAFYRRCRKAAGPLPPQRLARRVLLGKIGSVALPVSAAGLLNNFLASATTVIIPARLAAGGAPRAEAMTSFGVMTGMTIPLLSLPSAFLFPLTTVLLPRLSRYSALSSRGQLLRKAGKSLQATGLLAFPSFALMLAIGRPLAQLLYGQPGAGDHILWLGAATLFSFYHAVTGTLLGGIGLQKRSAASVVVTGVLEFSATWCWVGSRGIAGYAAACLVSEIAGVALNFRWLFRALPLRFQWKNWLLTPFLAASGAGLAARLLLPSGPAQWPGLLLCLGVFALCYLAFLRFLGLSLPRYLRQILQNAPRK